MKTYVLDTNVPLHDPDALFAFEENEVVITLTSLEELDRKKKDDGIVGYNARETARRLNELRKIGSLAEGVVTPNGGIIRIETKNYEVPEGFEKELADNKILAVAYNLNRANHRTILVTKDINLTIKADALDIRAEDYYTDKVDVEKLYTGVVEINTAFENINELYSNKTLYVSKTTQSLTEYFGMYNDVVIRPNQFVLLKSYDGNQSALCRYNESRLYLVNETEAFGIKATNKEQRFALDMLLDDRVKVVTLIGRAGTGKTLLAIAAGLQKVLEDRKYRRLLVCRPIVPMGNELGHLPGSKEEKLKPWMMPIYDNLDFIFDGAERSRETIEGLFEDKVIEIEALALIRGRSIPKQFIIIDEAQNLPPAMIKTVITRVGKGSKIILTGDPDQIDTPYLDASSNGLSYLVDHAKTESIAGHITLTKGERSDVAEFGARLNLKRKVK